MEEIIDILHRVIYTLNRVEVRGSDNINALLGSIQALEKVHADLVEAKKQSAEGAGKD